MKNNESMKFENKDGNALFSEHLVTRDMKALQESAKKGNVLAMRILYQRLNNEESNKDAFAWLAESAKAGDSESRYDLAMECLMGNVDNAEYTNIISDLLRKLSDKTLTEDEYNAESLAYLYLEAKDYEYAMKMFLKAEELNDTLGLGPYKNDDLAIMYYEGLGCNVDYKKAARYFNSNAAKFQELLATNGEAVDPNVWKNIADLHYHKELERKIARYAYKHYWNKVIEIYEKLGYCRPDEYNSVAWAYCVKGKYEAALPLAQKAIDHLLLPCAYDTLATALQGIGRYTEAIAAFEICLDMYTKRQMGKQISETEQKIELLKEKVNNSKK